MPKQTSKKFSQHEKHILSITGYGHFLSHFNMLVFPALVLPLTGILNLEISEVLGLSLWMYLLFGVTALPWGILSDRWKVRNLLFIFYLGAGISGLSAAFWLESPLGLTLSLAGMGLFSGIYHPAGLGWISKEFEHISMGMAINGMCGNVGLASAPLMAGLLYWFWGAQSVYILVGILNFLGMGLILFLSEPEKQVVKSSKSGEDQGMISAFVILLFAMMMGGIAYRGISVVIPTYFELKNQDIFNWLTQLSGQEISKNLIATSITSIIFLVGMVGQYAGGYLASRFNLTKCYLLFHSITIPAVFAMAYVHDLPLVFFTLIYFFFLLGMQPIENTLVSRLTPRKLQHSAFGFKFVVTFGVGSLAVKMVGLIEENQGMEAIFTVMGVISIALVGTILLLIRHIAGRVA